MNIQEVSKLLAVYDGLQYVPFNDLQGFPKPGWYHMNLSDYHPLLHHPKSGYVKGDSKVGKFICRNHSGLRYFNSYDSLFSIVARLEKEDLSEFFDPINFMQVSVDRFDGWWDVSINLNYDPPLRISEIRPELKDKEQLFWCLVDAVEYINKLKNEQN